MALSDLRCPKCEKALVEINGELICKDCDDEKYNVDFCGDGKE